MDRRTPVVPTVLSQHAEEAAFQWLLRDMAVRAPHYSLRDLADQDDRVEAHLDGLRIAGDAGWEVVSEELGWEEPGEVFAAAAAAYESGDPAWIEEVLDVASGSVELARGAVSALGWLPEKQAVPHLDDLLESDDPIRRRIGVGAAAAHRHDPGARLAELVASDEPAVRTRALRAAGELGRTDLLSPCRRALQTDDDEVRFWGAWSGTLLGDRDAATRVLYATARAGGRRAERAGDLLARSMPPERVLAWQRQLADDGERLRLGCRVAGALGNPGAVPWLLEVMTVEEVARPAAEAFSMITGVDLDLDDLEGEWPEGFEAGPTGGAADEDVAMDPDEDLPWPDPELVRSWWEENRGGYATGTRYLLGRPMETASLQRALRAGMQRQRGAAALELALSRPGATLFEVRARGDRQAERLEA